MGIPGLTRHLRDYGEPVVLGGQDSAALSPHDRHAHLPRIASVAIDGPSLVFAVYLSLRSWKVHLSTAEGLSPLDAQPTCDEVSRGFVRYICSLVQAGVRVEKIYFDGALPISKRPVRLARLEKTRQAAQKFYQGHIDGVRSGSAGAGRLPLQIAPEQVFCPRATPSRYTAISLTEFIVAQVIEDLMQRWTSSELRKHLGSHAVPHDVGDVTTPVFADRTEMVCGEADTACAVHAKRTGASVLSQDSDLLLHDLGDGALVLLDSVSLSAAMPECPLSGDGDNGSSPTILAQAWRPAAIARRLGVDDIRRLGFEIFTNPSMGLLSLVHHCDLPLAQATRADEFLAFADEYTRADAAGSDALTCATPPHIRDPRIAELYFQLAQGEGCDPQFQDETGAANMYFPVLLEDCARSAAYAQGSDTRVAAYSILNLLSSTISAPAVTGRKRTGKVVEYMRRGQQIAAVDVQLLSSQDGIFESVQLLWSKIHCVQHAMSLYQMSGHAGNQQNQSGRHGTAAASMRYWKAFALCEVLTSDSTMHKSMLSNRGMPLATFLRAGSSTTTSSDSFSRTVQWRDLHLRAQMQASLYSVKIFKQLVGAALAMRSPATGIDVELAETVDTVMHHLRDLPPVQDTVITPIADRADAERLVDVVFSALGEERKAWR
ncbi:hypothetical protein KEM52_003432 [Ascosphaera acerosa]|nr:hypothetical protein KEM52_003432 [Ascosphaera acerosa]